MDEPEARPQGTDPQILKGRGAKIALIIGCLLVAVLQLVASAGWGRSVRSALIILATWATLGLVIAGLAFGKRWALRAIAFLIAAVCLWYLADALVGGFPHKGPGPRSIWEPVAVFIAFGLPALKYLFTGRLFLSHASEEAEGDPSSEEDTEVFLINSDDPRMQAAVDEARRRWPEFLKAFENRGPHDIFAVKAPFTDGEITESMWVNVESIEGGGVSGMLANEPLDIASLAQGDQVCVTAGEICDWGYRLAGQEAGNFTQKVIEAAGMDDSAEVV